LNVYNIKIRTYTNKTLFTNLNIFTVRKMKNLIRFTNAILQTQKPQLVSINSAKCLSHKSNGGHEKINDMVGKSLLSLKGYEPRQIEDLLWSALDMKKVVRNGNSAHKLTETLRGKSFAAIFQKKSTRTRLSFEAGAHQLGAHAVFCNKEDIHLGVNETVKDTGLVMSRLVNAIVARVYEHSLLEDLAKFSSQNNVPVINALSDTHHPMQALADLMTIYEHFGRLNGLKIAWVGDGNNVLHSILIAGVKMRMHVAAACPKGYEMNQDVLKYAQTVANENKTQVITTEKPEEAVKNADIIVTDTWISMGQEAEKKERLRAFAGYQVSMKMLENANKNWVFLHCLPRKMEEVDDEVFYDKRSLVFDEAENRKWTTMAVLANLLRGYTPSLIKQKPKF
jgi:ornithine carbamoyltransferase